MVRNEALSLVVIGAGGHAKVVIECFRASGWHVIGCTDADPAPRLCAGAPVIGTDEKLLELRAQGIGHAFCALGDNRRRERIGREIAALEFDLPTVCGPGARVSPSARLGVGCAILAGAVVNVDSLIGAFSIVNTNAGIDHDCMIGRAAHIGPGVSIAGEVRVGDRAFVATGSSVIPKINIGVDAVIGAGSVVVRDIPDGVIAYGNPALVKGPACME